MDRRDEIREHFDLLRSASESRMRMRASYLSGGEKHQLALAMVLMRQPRFLILDEPSAGLSPANIANLYQALGEMQKRYSFTTLIIEQNIMAAVKFSDRVVLLRNGVIAKSETAEALRKLDEVSEFVFN